MHPRLAKRVRGRMGAKLPLGKRQLENKSILPGRDSLGSDNATDQLRVGFMPGRAQMLTLTLDMGSVYLYRNAPCLLWELLTS